MIEDVERMPLPLDIQLAKAKNRLHAASNDIETYINARDWRSAWLTAERLITDAQIIQQCVTVKRNHEK